MFKALFFLLFLFFLVVFAIGGGIWAIFNVFSQLGFRPGTAAWDKLTRSMRGVLDQKSANLVAWDAEMLGLLSQMEIEHKGGGLFGGPRSGVFTTIYQEPVLAYTTQALKNARLTVARTSNRELVLREKGRETEIWANNQALGTLVDGVLLAADRGSRQLARVETQPDETQFPVFIGERPAAGLNNPALKERGGPNPRALTLLRNLTQDEETIVLALALQKLMA